MAAVLACAGATAGSAHAYEPRVPQDYFGISAPHLMAMGQEGDEVSLERHARAMSEAGLDWARVTVDWRMVEPLIGVDPLLHIYDWSSVDRVFRALARAGVTMVPGPYGTPYWARDLNAILAGCGGNAAVARLHMASYAAFVEALVRRYGRNGSFWNANPDVPPHPIERIELWNEPNWTGFWCPAPDAGEFGRLLSGAARSVKRVEPGIETVLGGLVVIKQNEYFPNGALRGQDPGTFMTEMVAADPALRDLIDVIGIHLYDADVDSNLSLLGWLRTRLKEVGMDAADLLVTEFGWRTGGPPGHITEEARAAHYRDLTMQLPLTDCRIAGVAAHDWTNLRSDPANPDEWFSIADRATAALSASGVAYRDVVALYEGRGPTPAPRETIPVCGGSPPDQDGDGIPDEADDYPTDPDRDSGAGEPPPPVLQPPAEQPTRAPRVPREFFVVANNFMPDAPDDRVRHYDEMARVGVKAVEETIDWRVVEPVRSTTAELRWADVDRRVLGYAKRGIAPTLTTSVAPSWMPTGSAGDRAYIEFLTAIAKRYGRNGAFWDENRHLDARLAPRGYKVWTAANTSAGAWDGGPSAAKYAALYRDARAALRAVDPQAGAIVALHDDGPAGSASRFLSDMVASEPGLRGGIDAVSVLTAARDVASVEESIVKIRGALDRTGNREAALQVGIAAPVGGTQAMSEDARAAFFRAVAARAPRIDCGVDQLSLSTWTSRQRDLTDPWDWMGVADVGSATAGPSATAFLDVARSALGFGNEEPATAALHPCFQEPLDRDGDGIPDPVDSHPLDPQRGEPAPRPSAPRFGDAPADLVNTSATRFSYSAAGAESFQCRPDEEGWRACGTERHLSGLSDGQHRFDVRAVDSMGLLSEVTSHRWTVDTRPPETHFVSAPSGTVQNERVSIALSSDESDVWFACRLDAGAWARCDSPVVFPDLADGPHVFRAFAVDGAGNADPTPVYREFTVRAVPDLPSIVQPEDLSSQTPVFRFDAAHAHRFECRFDSDPFQPCSSARSHTPARPLRAGFHRFAVRGVGATGKHGPAATWGFTTEDRVPPETMIVAGPTGDTLASPVTFKLASDDEHAVFACKINDEPWYRCPDVVQLTDLTPGQHVFRAAAIDSGNNTDPTPAERSFTLKVEDTAPELKLSFKRAKRPRAGTLRTRVSAASEVRSLRCRVNRGQWRDCGPRLKLRGLRAGENVARVRAIDEQGHLGQASLSFRAKRR